jgi:hypothetical protein
VNPDWFLDWRDEIAAIVASGPSTKKADYRALEGHARVLAIKDNVDLCPFADAVYGCDGAWWRNRLGLPKFPRLKIAYDGHVRTQYPDIKLVTLAKFGKEFSDRLISEPPGEVGCGGNSGFQAFNLAIQFGARRILLLGFDMNEKHSELHWYGRNNGPGQYNPDAGNFKRWRGAFIGAVAELSSLGVEVVNCSPVSTLKCFPTMTVPEALSHFK